MQVKQNETVFHIHHFEPINTSASLRPGKWHSLLPVLLKAKKFEQQKQDGIVIWIQSRHQILCEFCPVCTVAYKGFCPCGSRSQMHKITVAQRLEKQASRAPHSLPTGDALLCKKLTPTQKPRLRLWLYWESSRCDHLIEQQAISC